MSDARPMLRWTPHPEPLSMSGIAASGGVRGVLVAACLRRLDRLGVDEDPELIGVASESTVVVLGPVDCLPWVDGAQMLGIQADLPALHLPTNLSPNVPSAVLLAWIGSVGARMPCALLPGDGGGLALLPLDGARRLHRAELSTRIASSP